MEAAAATRDREPVLPPVQVGELAGEAASEPPVAAAASRLTGRAIAAASPPRSPAAPRPQRCSPAFSTRRRAGGRTGWLRRATVAVSLTAHALLLAVGAAYSFWTRGRAEPAPGGGQPADRARRPAAAHRRPAPPAATPKPRPRPQPTLQQPVTTAPVQPQPDEAETKARRSPGGRARGRRGRRHRRRRRRGADLGRAARGCPSCRRRSARR